MFPETHLLCSDTLLRISKTQKRLIKENKKIPPKPNPELSKKLWEDKEYRKKTIDGMKNYKVTKSHKTNLSKSMTNHWKNIRNTSKEKKWRNNMSTGQKKRLSDLNELANQKKRMAKASKVILNQRVNNRSNLIQKVFSMKSKGMNNREIANELGVHRRTFSRWINKHYKI